MGIDVLPPNVQTSGQTFSVESLSGAEKPALRFGLTAVKNVGEGAVDSIINARQQGPFQSLEDFCARIDTRLTNRKVIESLIKAGAFDSLSLEPPHQSRPRLLERMDHALETGQRLKDNVD